MKVSTSEPYQIIYALFEHEYLGYLFESFVVQLDENGKLTLRNQNICAQNANEFSKNLDESDFKLIDLMDSMQQDVIIRKFYRQKIKPRDFFYKIYKGDRPDETMQKEIHRYLETRRAQVLEMISGKMLFLMGNDGEPTWKQIEVLQDKASVLFHFRRNEDNTHYFPTIKYNGEKIHFQDHSSNCYIICREPAYMVCNDKLYSFSKYVDGNKLLPFLKKKFIVVPKNVEDTYYRKFIAPLVASFDVYAKGFDIVTKRYDPVPMLTLSELASNSVAAPTLFDNNENGDDSPENEKILFDISFNYNSYNFKTDNASGVSVKVESDEDNYTFHRIVRQIDKERRIINLFKDLGIDLRNSRCTLPKPQAIEWITKNRLILEEECIELRQKNLNNKTYFIGQTTISVEVRENIDWFDIHAVVKFGDYEIPFKELRKIILRKGNEIVLPNGQIGVIPESWIKEYSELFAFMDDNVNGHQLTLKKHHLSLIKDLETGNLASVCMNKKLENLRNFEEIEDVPMPVNFNGSLRPYQKAGFNWLKFLQSYRFGGCLADDMGLGKTVQTLAFLQSLKESENNSASLLIMPTSLIYNWEMEARKFTPELKILNYTGTSRIKDVAQFEGKDLVLTSYGIARLDIDLLQEFYFNYIILDESQAIKNPNSNISKSVKKLKSRNKLILTGTPLENSTLDLWSQMTFINPGLLGNQSFFKNEFLLPIEKKKDQDKTKKLYSIIKPFIMRRHKSQVAKELPEKVESVKYCSMSTAQEEQYEEAKSYYRNQILDQIESVGVNKSQMILLQGLTKLRQIANHPKMTNPEYDGDSGKLDTVIRMLTNAISEDHKTLIFSQFVKHLTIVADYLKENNIDFAYLDGSTKDRQAQVERFQNDDNLKVFLISLKAGGLGLNLTKAEYVFILDPWWNPAVEQQAVDRAHRIGQQNTVFTYKFISKNTVEEKILALQNHKVRLAQDLITTEESFVKDLSKEDIELLFE